MNNTNVRLYYDIGCIVQDLDSEFNGETGEQQQIDLVDTEKELDDEERFEEFDPEAIKDTRFRVVVSRKMSLRQALTLLAAVIDLDSKGIPGSGKLALSYADGDKSLQFAYNELLENFKKEQEAAAAAEAKALKDAEEQKVALELAKTSTTNREVQNGGTQTSNPNQQTAQ
jgi:hypothetical protein